MGKHDGAIYKAVLAVTLALGACGGGGAGPAGGGAGTGGVSGAVAGAGGATASAGAPGTGGLAAAGGTLGYGGAPTPSPDGGLPSVDAMVPEAGGTEVATEPAEVIPDRGPRSTSGCPAEEAEARVLFDIPRAGDVSGDFFRLPFPNDIRRSGGRLALADFPRPLVLPGLDVFDRVVKAIEAEGLGYGPNPAVTFRLTRAAAFDAATGKAPVEAAVRYVDITQGTPEFGKPVAHHLGTLTPGRYLCARHLLVLRDTPAPLLPGHTYAVMLTSALTDLAGKPFSREPDFAAVMGPAPQSGSARAAAWKAYAPLRHYVATAGIDAKSLVAAAVFTVDAYDQPAAKLRAAVRALPAPVWKDIVRCGPGVASVCDQGRPEGRTCAAASDEAPFVLYQGRLEIPVFQQGTPPYETTGGGINYGADGTPAQARREDVCFALTVPKGPVPAAGFPVVLYGHGTGGDFRSPVESGLGRELGEGFVAGPTAVPMATLTFDGVLHGSRKGNSNRSVDELVYNVFNPTASRDNSLQAAADFFAFARALPGLVSDERRLDLARVAVYGHSQGGNAAAIAGGYESDFGAVVLSGTGGGIAQSLLEKKKPIPAATVLPLIIGEAVSSPHHPAMALMQLYFDRADPLNHGRRIAAAPMAGAKPRHLLHVFGANDGYAPVSTQLAFAVGARLPVLRPVVPLASLGSLGVIVGPVRLNFLTGTAPITAVEAQFSPTADYDGHFVSTHNPAARAAIGRFLGTFFRDGTPEVD